MTTIWRLCRVMRNQRYTKAKNLLLLTVLLLVVFVFITYPKKPVLADAVEFPWAGMETCPACFGDTCGLLQRGHFVQPESDRYFGKGIVSIGRIGGVMAIAKTLGDAWAWKRYEKFICRSSLHPHECNAASFILESMLVTDSALKLPWLREAWRISQEEKPALPICLSERFLQEVKGLYAENGGTNTTNGGSVENGFLSTSFHINEEAVLLRYFTTKPTTTPWPFPKYFGACGRVIVVEHAGRTLDKFMDSPWDVRADIAVQLLQLVDTLRGKDPEWVPFFLDATFQNFAVDSRGWVRLIDLDDVMVIDRRTTVSHQELDEICNEDCYMEFQKKLFFSDRYHCEDVLKYTPMMYANICARILSDLQKHPELREWGEKREHKVVVKAPTDKGLLHDAPDEIRGPLEGAIAECVQETQPVGRLKAVLTLKQLLEMS